MAESAGQDAEGCGELAAAPKAWAFKAAAIEGKSFQTNCLPSLSGGGCLAGGAGAPGRMCINARATSTSDQPHWPFQTSVIQKVSIRNAHPLEN
jgi:hypothetical protein